MELTAPLRNSIKTIPKSSIIGGEKGLTTGAFVLTKPTLGFQEIDVDKFEAEQTAKAALLGDLAQQIEEKKARTKKAREAQLAEEGKVEEKFRREREEQMRRDNAEKERQNEKIERHNAVNRDLIERRQREQEEKVAMAG